jgi:hypothetical protein
MLGCMSVEMKKICWVTAICFLLVTVMLADFGYAEMRPALSSYYIGNWSGTTSQGLPIRLKIEDIDGATVVTQLGYEIILEVMARGWSKTVDRLEPQPIWVKFTAYEFSYKERFDLYSVELTGYFVSSSLLKGTLKETNIYPVDIIIAAGEVTYTAKKE